MTPLAGILPCPSPRTRLRHPCVGWQWADLPLIMTSVVSAAGFTMANNNTGTS